MLAYPRCGRERAPGHIIFHRSPSSVDSQGERLGSVHGIYFVCTFKLPVYYGERWEQAPCMLRCSFQLLRTLQSSAHQQLHGIGTSINRARSVGLGSSRSSHEADAGMCAIAPSTRRASAPADPKHSRSLAVTILLVRDEVGEAKRVRARAGKFGLRTSEVAKTGRKPLSFSHPESHPKPDPTPKPNGGAKTEG